MELDFNNSIKELEDQFESIKKMILATCFGSRVTARTVSIINHKLNLFFQTDSLFDKYKQIIENNNVALCSDNIQIEGKAFESGHPMDENNVFFRLKFMEKHKNAFSRYSHMESEVVFRIEPVKISLWKYIDNKPCRDIISLERKKAERVFYN